MFIENELKCSNCLEKFSTDKHFWFEDNPLCQMCDEENRKYHQKFMDLHLDPNFTHNILAYIDTERISISDLVKHFQKELGVEIFQHEVDIGVSIKFIIDDLLKNQIIKLYTNDKEIDDYPLTEEQYRHLIANENGTIIHNLSIII